MRNAELKFMEMVPNHLKEIAKQLTALNENTTKLLNQKRDTPSQMKQANKVVTICYNQRKEWNNRKDAIKFFTNGIKGCDPDSSEHERYVNVYLELLNGNAVCTDTPNKEYYSQVNNDYYDEEDHFYRIDAWKTDDDNEEGKVIAVVHDPSGDVYYVEPEARISPLAQNAILQRVDEIRTANTEQKATQPNKP